jgi:hypothetical protein
VHDERPRLEVLLVKEPERPLALDRLVAIDDEDPRTRLLIDDAQELLPRHAGLVDILNGRAAVNGTSGGEDDREAHKRRNGSESRGKVTIHVH